MVCIRLTFQHSVPILELLICYLISPKVCHFLASHLPSCTAFQSPPLYLGVIFEMQNTTSNIAITDPLQSTSTPPPLEQQQPSPTHSLNIANIPIRTTPRRAILSYQAQRAKSDIMELREEIGGLERMLEEVRFGGRKTGIGCM